MATATTTELRLGLADVYFVKNHRKTKNDQTATINTTADYKYLLVIDYLFKFKKYKSFEIYGI